MAILNRFTMEKLERKVSPLPHHKAGLSWTATGYGRKIPTRLMVRLPDSKRWRRVYCCIFSNIGTCYVTAGKDWVVVD